jgi:predicted nucleotidyltransferase
MRLTESQLVIIKHIVSDAMSSLCDDWQLWLFGSRINDEARGGDVDLCLCANASAQTLIQLKWQLRPQLEEALDIPVDLVVQSSLQPMKGITQQAMKTGIKLL